MKTGNVKAHLYVELTAVMVLVLTGMISAANNQAKTVRQIMTALVTQSVAQMTINADRNVQGKEQIIVAARIQKGSAKMEREIVMMTGNVKAP